MPDTRGVHPPHLSNELSQGGVVKSSLPLITRATLQQNSSQWTSSVLLYVTQSPSTTRLCNLSGGPTFYIHRPDAMDLESNLLEGYHWILKLLIPSSLPLNTQDPNNLYRKLFTMASCITLLNVHIFLFPNRNSSFSCINRWQTMACGPNLAYRLFWYRNKFRTFLQTNICNQFYERECYLWTLIKWYVIPPKAIVLFLIIHICYKIY